MEAKITQVNGSKYNKNNLNSAAKDQKEDEIIMVIDDGKVKLRRELGVMYGVAIIVGLVIGGGIYITSKGVLVHAGSPGYSLIIWVVGGVITMIGALCYAEMGVNFPVSGEKYAYLSEFYGPYFGYLFLSVYILLLRPGSNSFKVLLLGRYVLKPFFPDCEIPEIAVKLIATFVAILMCGINCISVKFAARGQSLMTSVTLSTLLLISGAGIYMAATVETETFNRPFENTKLSIDSFVMAIYSTNFAYGGWSALNFLVEEVKNPSRTLPITVVISCTILTIIYTLVNYAYLVVLGVEGVLTSDAIATSFALKVWKPLAWILSICIAISTGSSFNSGILVGSRLAFAGARNGHIPKMISYVSISQVTPIISVLLHGILITIFVWFMKIEFLIYNLVFCFIIFDLATVIGYLRFRYQNRFKVKKEKQLRLPIILFLLYALMSVATAIIPLIANFWSSTIVFITVVVATSTYYLVFNVWDPVILRKNKRLETLNNFIQKLFYCAPGGKE